MLCLEKYLDFCHWYLRKLYPFGNAFQGKEQQQQQQQQQQQHQRQRQQQRTTATTPVNQPVKSHPWLQMPLEPGWAMAVSERPWRRVVTWHKIDDRYADFSWLLYNMKYLFWMHTKKYTTYNIKPVLLCMIVLSYFVFAFMDSLVCKV